MKRGKILFWVGLLILMVGIYLQTSSSTHWFVIGTLIALFGMFLNAITLYMPKSNGGEGIKLKKTNVLGWMIFIFWSMSVFFFKEELSIITTGLGGLIFLISGMTLIFYKGKEGIKKH